MLEHIPDAERFARKLFAIADRVLITVPYEWPANLVTWHVHDPVDFEKLHLWTQRVPLHRAVIEEPHDTGLLRKRMLAYYRASPLTESEKAAIDDLGRGSRRPTRFSERAKLLRSMEY